jgi:hypothetical protein
MCVSSIAMASALLVKYTFPNSMAPRITIPPPGQTIRQLITFIAQKHGADVDTVSFDACILNEDEPLDTFSDSPNQFFAFLKSARGPVITTSRPSVSRPRPGQPPVCPKSPSITQPMSGYVRDFRSFKTLRVIGKGAFGKVKLPSIPMT